MSTSAASSFTTTTFNGSAPADTAGWDVVYAVKAGGVNAALADYFGPGGSLASTLTFSQAIEGSGTSMQGQFGAWQLTTGGSGQQLNLSLPIVSGSATIVGIASTPTTIDLAGAALTVQATLGFHPVAGASSGTTTAALKVVTSGSAPAAGSASDITNAATSTSSDDTSDPTVTVTAVTGLQVPAGIDPTLASTFIEALAKEWIAANLSIFDYVFLSVDVAETAATGEWSWIKPTYVGYAITDLLDAEGNPLPIENSIMAIMSLTEGRVPGLQPDGTTIDVSATVSVNAIPTNANVNAGLLIQPALVMSNIIQKNMPSLFDSSTDADFTFSSTSLTISNQNQLTLTLEMDPTWYPFSKTCTATIPVGDLKVIFAQTEVQQQFNNISFPYGAQDELTIDLTLNSTSTIGIDQNGNFTMQYGNDTVSTLSVQPDASKIAAEALEGIGVNLVVTALCCLSFGAAGGELASAESAAGKVPVDPVVEPPVDDPVQGPGNEVPNAENLDPNAQQVAGDIDAGAASGQKVGGEIELTGQQNDVGVDQLNSQLDTSARAEMQNPSTWTLSGIMPRFTFKIWAMFVGQFAGQLYSNLSNLDIVEAYDQNPTEMPTLQNFLAGCISPATWTNTGNQELVCAGLNGAFVMGFTAPSTTGSTS
jgi:hypothetical protein